MIIQSYEIPLSDEQYLWIVLYELQTGFEVLYPDILHSGEYSFEEFARMNISWWESYCNDVQRSIGKYPQSEEDMFRDMP